MKKTLHLNNIWLRIILLFVFFIVSWTVLIQTKETFIGKKDVETHFWIIAVSLPVLFILWYFRTYDKVKMDNQNSYYNALNLLSKKDEPQSLRLAFIILLDLREKGIYRKDIENNIFTNLEIKDVKLNGLDLSNIKFDNSNFYNCSLDNSNISDSSFKNCIINNISLDKVIYNNNTYPWINFDPIQFNNAINNNK